MHTETIATSVGTRLGPEFTVVSNPDHPELLSGPDILIGGNGRLLAAFVIRRSTSKRDLEARVIATRLALPASAQMLAIVDPDSSYEPEFEGFDEQIDWANDQDIAELARAGRARNVSDLAEVQRKHHIFYSTILQVAMLRRRHEVAPSSPSAVVAQLHDRSTQPESDVNVGRWRKNSPNWPRHANSAFVSGSRVSDLPGSPESSARRRLMPLWSAALRDSFVFDTGVPYPVDLAPRILLVSTWPEPRYDPNKPVRAAAFGTWLMAIATTVEHVEALTTRTLDVLKKRLDA